MKIFTKDRISDNLVDDFAYEDNPEIFSKVVFLDMFSDKEFTKGKKIAVGYWEAPIGSYNIIFKDFSEIAYVMAGEMELISGYEKNIIKTGDYYYCKVREEFKVIIKKPIRMFFVLGEVSDKTGEIFIKKLIK